MTLTHYTDMVVRIMDDYVKKNGTDTIMTNKEIQDYLYKQRQNGNDWFLLSDFCYNIVNRGISSHYPNDKHLFKWVRRGHYLILGSNYPYTGEVEWTGHGGLIVGKWDKGTLTNWNPNLMQHP